MKCIKCYKSISSIQNYGSETEPLCIKCSMENDPTYINNNINFQEDESIIDKTNKAAIELDEGDDLITAQSYLTRIEAENIKACLVNSRIFAKVDNFAAVGQPNSWGNDYYRVDVQQKDAGKAKDIIKNYLQEIKSIQDKDKLEMTKCPKCNSNEFSKTNNLSFLERIRFFGCEVLLCQKCGRKWVV